MVDEYPSRPQGYPTEPAAKTYPEARPTRTLTGVKGTYGAVLLASFVLVIVGGIVAVVWALNVLQGPANEVNGIIALILGVVTIFAAILIWRGQHEMGGIFAIVAGIIFLVLGPDTAGIFAVLGGILAVIANKVADVVT